jgi:hypothetical protein
VPPADAPNEEKAWLVVGFCRRFNERFIQPKRLGFNKVDPMFGFVGRALCRIDYDYRIETMLFPYLSAPGCANALRIRRPAAAALKTMGGLIAR